MQEKIQEYSHISIGDDVLSNRAFEVICRYIREGKQMRMDFEDGTCGNYWLWYCQTSGGEKTFMGLALIAPEDRPDLRSRGYLYEKQGAADDWHLIEIDADATVNEGELMAVIEDLAAAESREWKRLDDLHFEAVRELHEHNRKMRTARSEAGNS